MPKVKQSDVDTINEQPVDAILDDLVNVLDAPAEPEEAPADGLVSIYVPSNKVAARSKRYENRTILVVEGTIVGVDDNGNPINETFEVPCDVQTHVAPHVAEALRNGPLSI